MADEDANAPVAVLSYAYWTSRYSRSPGVVGQTIYPKASIDAYRTAKTCQRSECAVIVPERLKWNDCVCTCLDSILFFE